MYSVASAKFTVVLVCQPGQTQFLKDCSSGPPCIKCYPHRIIPCCRISRVSMVMAGLILTPFGEEVSQKSPI